MAHATGAAYEVLTVTLNPAIDRTVTIHNFTAGAVNRVEQVRQNPGGKGVNVAVTLADAGHQVAAAGLLGRANSAVFEDLFARKQIADRFIRIAGSTRVGIKVVDPSRQQTTEINFPGPAPTPGDQAALIEQIAAVDAPWAVLAGSLPPAVAAEIYADLIVALRRRGRRVALDTSGDALRLALEAAPQIVKPNIHELATLVGHPLPTEAAVIAAADTLLARGVELVAVSLGQGGAMLVTPRQVLRARPPEVAVRSTVGAGDAMVAGLIAAQLRGLPLDQTAALATAFAADTVGRIGAGLSQPDTVAALQRRVVVERVER